MSGTPRPDDFTDTGAAEAPLTNALPARPKVSDAIIKALRMDIASGRLKLGAKLPTEKALARHFGASQPTVREAMRALNAMGLVESRHGSGVYVTGSTRDFVTSTLETLLQMEQVRILDALGVRRVLGRYSGRLACENATRADIEAMAAAMARCDEAVEVQDLAENTVAFQVAFSAAAHHPLLFALETFLIRLMMQFQIKAHGNRGIKSWRRQAGPFTVHRHRMVDGLRKENIEETLEEWHQYLDDVLELFTNDAVLSKVRLSDPESIRTVDEILLNMPTYEFPRQAAADSNRRLSAKPP